VSVAFESRSRVLIIQTLPLVGPERGDEVINALAVRKARIWRFARGGGHVVCSLRGVTRGLPDASPLLGEVLGRALVQDVEELLGRGWRLDRAFDHNLSGGQLLAIEILVRASVGA
jgi:hypothetical protein